jgi:hypothetical protein
MQSKELYKIEPVLNGNMALSENLSSTMNRVKTKFKLHTIKRNLSNTKVELKHKHLMENSLLEYVLLSVHLFHIPLPIIYLRRNNPVTERK